MDATNLDRLKRGLLRRLDRLTLREWVAISAISAIVSLLLYSLIQILMPMGVPFWTLNWSYMAPTDLGAVACPTVSRCYAVGGEGGSYQSTDGGTSWSRGTVLPGIDSFATISCPTTSFCVAAASSSSPYHIVTTNNGGVSWVPRASTTDAIGTLICLTIRTCLATTNSVELATDNLLRSTDGGASWHTAALPAPDISAMTCATIRICLAVAQEGTLLVSYDTGATWRIAQVNKALAGTFMLTCPSTRVCVLLQDGGLVNTPESSALLSTTDSGAHWRQVALWRDTRISAVACPTASLCLAVGQIPSGNPRSLVRVTRNSGRTWSTQTDPSWQHRFGVGSADGLNAIACANTSTCVAVGSDGVVLTTSDAGATWHPHSL